jgi:hypothetical protein
VPEDVEDHFEKVTKPVEEYYHFNNFEASNLPGAVVVSKIEAEKLDNVQRSPNDRFDYGVN